MKVKTFSFLTALLIILPIQLQATTWYVNKDGTGDKTEIQHGINMASPGDTVLVAPGSYYESTIVIGHSVHVISEAGPYYTKIIYTGSPADYQRVVHVDGLLVTGGIINCSIQGFTITGGSCDPAGGMGGGIYARNTDILIQGNIITYNWCAGGGGICVYGDLAPTIKNNLIEGNSAFVGAGIFIGNSTPKITIIGNTIIGNSASVNSGAIKIDSLCARSVVNNNIICYNSAPSGYCGGFDYRGAIDSLVFECNNVWSNSPSGTNYCGIPNQTGLNGNISEDPLFCGEIGSDNYYLQPGSPCAPANVSECCGGIRMGCFPVKCETEAQSSSWGKIKALMKKDPSKYIDE